MACRALSVARGAARVLYLGLGFGLIGVTVPWAGGALLSPLPPPAPAPRCPFGVINCGFWSNIDHDPQLITPKRWGGTPRKGAAQGAEGGGARG